MALLKVRVMKSVGRFVSSSSLRSDIVFGLVMGIMVDTGIAVIEKGRV